MSFSYSYDGLSGMKIANSYRYGYNGMESDIEHKGEGNSYTTEFRQYDPRIGKWLSLDPHMFSYPDMSPYVAFANNPIMYTDPEGLDPISSIVNGFKAAAEALKSLGGKIKDFFKGGNGAPVDDYVPDPANGKVLGQVDIRPPSFWQKFANGVVNVANYLEKLVTGNQRFVDDALVGHSSYEAGGGIQWMKKNGEDYSNNDWNHFFSKNATVETMKLMFGFAINSGISGKSSGSMSGETKDVLDFATDGFKSLEEISESKAFENKKQKVTEKQIKAKIELIIQENYGDSLTKPGESEFFNTEQELKIAHRDAIKSNGKWFLNRKK